VDLLFHVFSPVAPVALAERWSPFPRCVSALSLPLHHRRDGRAVFGVFSSTYGELPKAKSIHEKHFDLLLTHALDVAESIEGKILLVIEPGWSFSHEYRGRRQRKHIKRIMRNVGYRCTERVHRPWWHVW